MNRRGLKTTTKTRQANRWNNNIYINISTKDSFRISVSKSRRRPVSDYVHQKVRKRHKYIYINMEYDRLQIRIDKNKPNRLDTK